MADFGIMPDIYIFFVPTEKSCHRKNCSVSRIRDNAELKEISMQTSCKETAPVQSYQKVLFSLVPTCAMELSSKDTCTKYKLIFVQEWLQTTLDNMISLLSWQKRLNMQNRTSPVLIHKNNYNIITVLYWVYVLSDTGIWNTSDTAENTGISDWVLESTVCQSMHRSDTIIY